jgi:hypothetical protein
VYNEYFDIMVDSLTPVLREEGAMNPLKRLPGSDEQSGAHSRPAGFCAGPPGSATEVPLKAASRPLDKVVRKLVSKGQRPCFVYDYDFLLDSI